MMEQRGRESSAGPRGGAGAEEISLGSGRLAGAARSSLAGLGRSGHHGDGSVCLVRAQITQLAAAQRLHRVTGVEHLLAAVHADLVGVPLDGEWPGQIVVAAKTEYSLKDRLEEIHNPAHCEAPHGGERLWLTWVHLPDPVCNREMLEA